MNVVKSEPEVDTFERLRNAPVLNECSFVALYERLEAVHTIEAVVTSSGEEDE